MQELDGLKSSKEDSGMVIGATNRQLIWMMLSPSPTCRLRVDRPGVQDREGFVALY